MTQKMIRVVLTGGPCAGKTTISKVLGHAYSQKLVIVPEAASLLFKGGFPRWPESNAIIALQRAIYHTQIELENSYAAHFPNRILILDRGTIDGAAYWPEGAKHFFNTMGTNLQTELNRYDKVIYLESAGPKDYELHKKQNPSRTENWEEANALDQSTREIWSQHPNLSYVKNSNSFAEKITEVMNTIESL